MTEPKIKTLRLKNIEIDSELQSREGLNEEKVEEYAELMRGGVKFPPGRVFKSAGGSLWLSQGFHRVEAAKRAGLTEFDFEVLSGTRDDAEFDSACANAGHGLPRTTKDKQRAIGKALRLRPGWTDHQIATAVGVTHKTVGKARRALESVGEIPQLTEREGRDGKTYPVKPQVSSPTPDEATASGPDDEPEPEVLAPVSVPGVVYEKGWNEDGKPTADADELAANLKAHTPAVTDDPVARVELWKEKFGLLLKHLKGAGALLTELLDHHAAGTYLRRHEEADDRGLPTGRPLFVERPRVVRSGRHEGGWHSPDLARLVSAVTQSMVKDPCLACGCRGCERCHHSGFFPKDAASYLSPGGDAA